MQNQQINNKQLKNKMCFFGRKTVNTCINLRDEALGNRGSFKYLGITIDNKLTFGEHVNDILKKLAKFNGMMYKAKNYFPKTCLLKMCNSFIKPIISYGILIYGSTTKTRMDKSLKM